MTYDKEKTWDYLLLILRIWLGYRMFTASYSSVIGILTSAEERAFFQKWFTSLHFPFPVVMAFLAKGSELVGGIFIGLGLFAKKAASLVAFTMFVATISANLGKNFNIDGGFTISYCLFALIFVLWGAGRFSLDYLFFYKRKDQHTT